MLETIITPNTIISNIALGTSNLIAVDNNGKIIIDQTTKTIYGPPSNITNKLNLASPSPNTNLLINGPISSILINNDFAICIINNICYTFTGSLGSPLGLNVQTFKINGITANNITDFAVSSNTIYALSFNPVNSKKQLTL